MLLRVHRASCCDAVMADIHHIYCFSIRSIRITETLPPFPEDFYGAHRLPHLPHICRPTRACTADKSGHDDAAKTN